MDSNLVSTEQTSGSDCVDSPAGNMIPLDTILNLRRIDAGGKLFRSARQDRASPDDIIHLEELGIRTFFDMRSQREYTKVQCGTPKAIDQDVPVLVPKLPNPKTKPYPMNSAIPLKDLNGKHVVTTDEQSPVIPRRRYLIDFYSFKLILGIFSIAPLYKCLLSFIVIIVDAILGTQNKYLMRFFSRELNTVGMAGVYSSILEYGGKQLCFILKTLSDPANLPALLSCAHGKDRTGVATAMVLSILGKSDNYIAEDYALSTEGLSRIQSTVHGEIVQRFYLDESFALAKKETMLKTLALLRDKYGSVENYLESIGFGREDQEKLRQVLS
ncbi:uncharacterized protein LOC119726223 [Patiria miniata]|uniref:Tyrosine specific protein phosphatases domain-containing protein n=1 Tax=Patiria miniata TaxID=46514 RepID=A0A913ZRP6_PATMI|nr:uncharacterized protein LOC119726223 [Patiria miniata]XP_038053760.1 uncharacterized protein LOC119726223 [Patiria miniata]XP_038053761.1 uncharacterized protein LOC119726223 [Patiria miniata]XP_038053762.1 uncharacterized protein LOC119726223 [Patiria miniata]XP_038053763.1 uncharacterized protein LOC119726223 [Patiria miniata]